MKPKVILCGAPPVYKIVVGASIYYFEDHSYCGPWPVSAKDYEPLDDVDFDDKFWWAVTCWYQQGKRVGRTVKDGVKMCVWERDEDIWSSYRGTHPGRRR